MDLAGGQGHISTTHVGRAPRSVPSEYARTLAPAECLVYEWTDYWVRWPGAEQLDVGGAWADRIGDGLFRVRFENQLGLTWLRPYAGGRTVGSRVPVEVLSPKFSSADSHVEFLTALLDDLFARATGLPFAVAAGTGRGVAEHSQPPGPLFTLHFLLRHAAELQAAWQAIHARPHRALRDEPATVPLAAASEADADVLLDVLRSPERWVRARGFHLADRLGGFAPREIWQHLPAETLDTPENRFVLAFLSALLVAAERLPSRPWWPQVGALRQSVVLGAIALLRRALDSGMFEDVKPMRSFPSASRVLMRREGYLQARQLWEAMQRSRNPLFGALDYAIDIRDVATLYETWAFFALAERIGLELGESPAFEVDTSELGGLDWDAQARFGRVGRLVYNRYGRSYSVPLRPDFTWIRDGAVDVVLDAKFRLERSGFDAAEAGGTGSSQENSAKRDDLYKMHTYRDALRVRAAVVVYPGNSAAFYHRSGGPSTGVDLHDLLLGSVAGVGAIPLRPGTTASEEIAEGSPT